MARLTGRTICPILPTEPSSEPERVRHTSVLKTLYAKRAGTQAIIFFLVGVVFLLATEHMIEGQRMLELATDLIVGAVLFSLLAALLVFHVLTRRLAALTAAVGRFREEGFAQPIRLHALNPTGDDIDKLGAAVQEMSERIVQQLGMLAEIDVRRRELLANVSH